MKVIRIENTDDLRARLTDFGSGLLFRGQTKHYEKAGYPSIATSFDRYGCIPPVMIKWMNYAKSILSGAFGERFDSLTFTHAILQHYGWRSWYVDCTTSAHVASWFASHSYREKLKVTLVEDYDERPIFLRYRPAIYEFADGDGYLYVIDRTVAESICGLTDLCTMQMPEARFRAEAQAAWLIGPLQSCTIPKEAFIAQISAPRIVFREFAIEGGIFDTSRLFPSSKEDPILRVLLGLPWQPIEGLKGGASDIPAFRRALDLPEYHDAFQKIMPPNIAFYSGESIGLPSPDDGIVIPVGPEVLYGSADNGAPIRFPKIQKILARYREVIFEVGEIMRHPHMLDSPWYQKGLVIINDPSGAVALCELVVEHPGLDLISSGAARGWFYRIDENGLWNRESHPEECDCHDDRTHLRHLNSLRIVEASLP